jgi:hypothetical protein
MAADLIGVNALTCSLTNRADDPATRRAVGMMLQGMQQDLLHVQSAIHRLESALRSPGSVFGTNAGRTKKELRDWILSVLMAYSYLELEIGGKDDLISLAKLAERAATVAAAQRAMKSPILVGPR